MNHIMLMRGSVALRSLQVAHLQYMEVGVVPLLLLLLLLLG